MGKPCAKFVVGMWGTWLSGAVAVPLALNHPEAELLHVLSDAGVSIIFATKEYRELLEPAAKKCDARSYLLPSVAGTCNDKSHGPLPMEQMEAQVQKVSSSIRGEQVALIIYTSWTMGKPKGAVHTHASIGAQDTSRVSQQEASLSQAPIQNSITLFSRYKNGAPSNGSMRVGIQVDGAQKDDLSSKGEEKMKGLHNYSFQDVRDISTSQSLLKTETSIDMVEALKRLAPPQGLRTI